MHIALNRLHIILLMLLTTNGYAQQALEITHLDQPITINVIGLDYFFTNDLWIRIFTQTNSQSDKFYLYGLLGWRFKPPFGAAYLIVNTDQYQNRMNGLPISERLRSEIVFLKLTYPISVLKN
ncbi:MAG: hypothetical protein E2O88_04560 [Bacteroidetes bacterium]|nr:MAG: hypothetical protein E2O88_04560 [Bacteroidota bacterium]